MSDNRKYYYMRLKENFFDSEEMLILESLDNGLIYSNILLKMYLRSLKREGKLMLSDAIPYDIDMLSKVLKHEKEHVTEALEWFQKLELVEVLDNGAIYMLNIQNFIGSASSEADRIRTYRRGIKEAKGESVTNVQYTYNERTPETETEIEIEKKTETETKTDRNISASASVSASATACLFSLDELLDIVKENKVNLSNTGVLAFYNEMQKTNWMLYGQKVEPEYVVRSLRAYSKYNEKYHLSEEDAEELVGDDWRKDDEELKEDDALVEWEKIYTKRVSKEKFKYLKKIHPDIEGMREYNEDGSDYCILIEPKYYEPDPPVRGGKWQ